MPLVEEWEYITKYFVETNVENQKEINKVKSGKSNKIGLNNLDNNVSEWTSSSKNGKVIVKGKSWKGTQLKNEDLLLDKDTKTGYIGFRIVRTFIEKTK